jgi:hypothetical protein
MKKETKPWLDPRGQHLPTETLKEISKSWGTKTWDEYLLSLEHGIEGRLINPRKFKKKCDYLKESIWEYSSGSANSDLQHTIREALAKLTAKQKAVIQKYFFEGRSETIIANDLERHRTTINEIKINALNRIKAHLDKNPCNLPSMKGQENFQEDVFDEIEKLYWEKDLPDEAFYHLWALAEMGGIKKGDLL